MRDETGGHELTEPADARRRGACPARPGSRCSAAITAQAVSGRVGERLQRPDRGDGDGEQLQQPAPARRASASATRPTAPTSHADRHPEADRAVLEQAAERVLEAVDERHDRDAPSRRRRAAAETPAMRSVVHDADEHQRRERHPRSKPERPVADRDQVEDGRRGSRSTRPRTGRACRPASRSPCSTWLAGPRKKFWWNWMIVVCTAVRRGRPLSRRPPGWGRRAGSAPRPSTSAPQPSGRLSRGSRRRSAANTIAPARTRPTTRTGIETEPSVVKASVATTIRQPAASHSRGVSGAEAIRRRPRLRGCGPTHDEADRGQPQGGAGDEDGDGPEPRDEEHDRERGGHRSGERGERLATSPRRQALAQPGSEPRRER